MKSKQDKKQVAQKRNCCSTQMLHVELNPDDGHENGYGFASYFLVTE